MVEVAGRPIVDTLLDALAAQGIKEIVVVTGYESETLEKYLRQRSEFRWRWIHNERYATTNNILSLQVANAAIKAPFLLVESDVHVQPHVLSALREPDNILVAPYAPDMDGTGITIDADGLATEMVIRAHLARPESLGEMYKTVNFYSFSEATWQVYREALDRWVQEGKLDQYYEAVLAELINKGAVRMSGVDVGVDGWAEIDDVEDLKRLESALAR